MNKGGASISLTYLASEQIVPGGKAHKLPNSTAGRDGGGPCGHRAGILRCAGYGGGMSSAKAALESDTRVLAFEAGRKFGVRVNTISAGPLGSRAAKVCTRAAVWGCVALRYRACMQMHLVLPSTRCAEVSVRVSLYRNACRLCVLHT